MLTLFGKKKISEDKLANVLVNSISEFAERGFPEVVEIINNCPEFVESPEVSPENNDEFLMILLVGNLNFMTVYLDPDQSERIKNKVVEKFSKVLEMPAEELAQLVKEYKQFMMRVNHPSKNMLYAMSKGMFHKYDLNPYQEEFFRNQKTANPIFQKRLDDIMTQFIFNWEEFLNKYKIGGN